MTGLGWGRGRGNVCGFFIFMMIFLDSRGEWFEKWDEDIFPGAGLSSVFALIRVLISTGCYSRDTGKEKWMASYEKGMEGVWIYGKKVVNCGSLNWMIYEKYWSLDRGMLVGGDVCGVRFLSSIGC